MKSNRNSCVPAKFSFWGRRMRIRILSFFAAVVVAGGVTVWNLKKEVAAAETALEYSYQQSLSELASYVDNIDVSLEKTLCAGTSSGAVMQAAKVWREAAAAKACLAALPYSDRRLENTGKFLSQVGEYAYSLTNRASVGESITKEERQNLEKLSGYASSLKEQLYSLLYDIAENEYSVKSVMSELYEELDEETDGSELSQMDGSYEDYPSLIYDGPFSDHIEKGKAKFLEGKSEITEKEAMDIAKRILNEDFEEINRVDSNVPVYVMTKGGKYAEVSVRGGIVVNYSDSRQVSVTAYSVSDALSSADNFLKEQGVYNMVSTYYIEDDNTLLINYAYSYDGVVCYPDLIKVTVAMDDLSVIGFESAGYIANHTRREKPETILTPSEAMKSVSTYLTAESGRMAYICPNGLTEYYVYEIKCVAESGRQVLVYVDAVTGREVDILLLLDTPGGTLTV